MWLERMLFRCVISQVSLCDVDLIVVSTRRNFGFNFGKPAGEVSIMYVLALNTNEQAAQ